MMFLIGWLFAWYCETSIETEAWGNAAFWGLMAMGCFLCETKTSVTFNKES